MDFPTASGSGNTTDGNTSRKIFARYEETAEITGFDATILYRLGVVLDVINSGYEIDSTKFREYGVETAHLYAERYPWWPMNAAIHIILIHGADVMDTLKVPLGDLTEGAQES